MSDLVETVGEDAAQHYRRKLDEAGTLRVRAGELMNAFGFTDMTRETRESVADMLWEAELRTEPPLGSSRIRRRSKLKLVPANAGLVETRYAINPVGTAMAVVGGLLFALASFLPLDEPGGAFARVQSNSLIQHSEWWLLVVGAAIVVVALRSYTSGQRKQATSVAPAFMARPCRPHSGTARCRWTARPKGEGLSRSTAGTARHTGLCRTADWRGAVSTLARRGPCTRHDHRARRQDRRRGARRQHPAHTP